MSQYRDEYLIFRSLDIEPLVLLREEIISAAKSIAEEEWDRDLSLMRVDAFIPKPVEVMANFGAFLFLPPDGSKEGLEMSQIWDSVREYIITKYLDKWNYKNSTDFVKRIYYVYVVEDEYSGLSVSDEYYAD